VGFILPSYQSSLNTECPVTTIQISSSNSAVSAPAGLNNPVVEGSNLVVKPTDTSLHQGYTFYTKVTVSGGSNKFFGPYEVKVGCYAGSVTYSDAGDLVTSPTKYVGQALTSAYTFKNPVPSQSYCAVVSNVIVKTNGNTWTGADKLTPQGSQPHIVFDLVSTSTVETFSFKMKTTFPNSMTH
jgi:hypothetical protein